MQSNPFIEVKVVPNFEPYVTVTWRLDPAFKDEAPFKFTLEVSETPDFSELIFSKKAGNLFFATDTNDAHQSGLGSYLYRVKLETGSGRVYYSKYLNYFARREDVHKYLLAREIVRREFVRFNYTGYEGYLIKRKNYGEIAQGSVDSISGVPIVEGGIDVGTGFIGGYYAPLRIRFSEEAYDQKLKLSAEGFGVEESEIKKIRMVGFPIIENKDIIVTIENDRYSLEDAVPTYFPGTRIVIVQLCTAKRLPINDPIYQIPIPTNIPKFIEPLQKVSTPLELKVATPVLPKRTGTVGEVQGEVVLDGGIADSVYQDNPVNGGDGNGN